MSELAAWLRAELNRRGLTQNVVAVYAGVGQATISDILNKGHVPKVETLFRLADYFETPRDAVLRLAGKGFLLHESRATLELDPVLDPIRTDPAYRQTVTSVYEHAAAERILLEDMRAQGLILRRGPG